MIPLAYLLSVGLVFLLSKSATNMCPSAEADGDAAGDSDAPAVDRLTMWNEMWNAGNIGWHESDVNVAIKEHGDLFIPNFSGASAGATPDHGSGVRVFCPLCGKTVDMAYLASLPAVSQVVGVDGIDMALTEFSKEQSQLDIRKEPKGAKEKYGRYVGKKTLLLKGDFFDLDDVATDGRVDAVFDRGSLVAITPNLREQYVQVMKRLISPGGKILLVAFQRNKGEGDETRGPPYSVPEAEVRRLYEGQDWIESVKFIEEKSGIDNNVGANMIARYFLISAKK